MFQRSDHKPIGQCETAVESQSYVDIRLIRSSPSVEYAPMCGGLHAWTHRLTQSSSCITNNTNNQFENRRLWLKWKCERERGKEEHVLAIRKYTYTYEFKEIKEAAQPKIVCVVCECLRLNSIHNRVKMQSISSAFGPFSTLSVPPACVEWTLRVHVYAYRLNDVIYFLSSFPSLVHFNHFNMELSHQMAFFLPESGVSLKYIVFCIHAFFCNRIE